MKGRQVPTLILPTSYAAGTGTLASTETVANAVAHISIDLRTQYFQEKLVHIYAIEVVGAAVAPGPLWAWIEVSPYPRNNDDNIWPYPYPTSAATWGAIGGGGGVNPVTLLPIIAPVAPTIEVGTAVNLTGHNILLPWTIDSNWARLVVQTPVVVATAWWVMQAYFSAKTAS